MRKSALRHITDAREVQSELPGHSMTVCVRKTFGVYQPNIREVADLAHELLQ